MKLSLADPALLRDALFIGDGNDEMPPARRNRIASGWSAEARSALTPACQGRASRKVSGRITGC